MNALQIVVIGPAGCGKTTVGQQLAERLGVPFADGDDFHPPVNRARMAAGVPLDDAARAPWLATLHRELQVTAATGLVLACSALKRTYRVVLAADLPHLRFVELDVPATVLRARLADRRGHFFAPTLLDDQLASLEPLGANEGLRIDGTAPPVALAARIAAWAAC